MRVSWRFVVGTGVVGAVMGAAAAVGAGCNSISGVDDFSFGQAASSSASAGGGGTTSASSTGSGGSGAGGSGGGGAAGATVPCAPDLEPSFTEGWTTVVVGGGTAVVDHGDALLTLEVGDGGLSVAQFVSKKPLALSDCYVSIDFAQAFGSTDPDAYAFFGVVDDTEMVMQGEGFLQSNGKVWITLVDGGAYSMPDEVPVDSAAPGYLRLREAGGKTHFERSVDGTAWKAIATHPTVELKSQAFATLSASATKAPPVVLKAVFRDFR